MNKKYWLRVGIGVGAVYALLFVAWILFAYITEGRSQAYTGGAGFGLALIPLALSSIPASLILEWAIQFLPSMLRQSIDHSLVGVISLMFIFGVVQWFLAGAFIGWVYGKFKNKKSGI